MVTKEKVKTEEHSGPIPDYAFCWSVSRVLPEKERELPCPAMSFSSGKLCYKLHPFTRDSAYRCSFGACDDDIVFVSIMKNLGKAKGYCEKHAEETLSDVVGVLPFLVWDKKDPFQKPKPILVSSCNEISCKCNKTHLYHAESAKAKPADETSYFCFWQACQSRPYAIYSDVTGRKYALCKTHAKDCANRKDIGEIKIVSIWPLWTFPRKASSTSIYGGKGGYTSCKHWRNPVKVGESEVLCSSRSGKPHDLDDADWPDVGVYLDSGWAREHWMLVSPGTKAGKDYLADMRTLKQETIVLDWTDFSDYPIERLKAVVKWTADRVALKKSIEIACVGSHGRTGTFLACLLVEVEGLEPAEAIEEARKRHCTKAVENQKQIKLVYAYAGKELPDKSTLVGSKETSKTKTKSSLPGTTASAYDGYPDDWEAFDPYGAMAAKKKKEVEPEPAIKLDKKKLIKLKKWAGAAALPKKIQCPFCSNASKRDKWRLEPERPEYVVCPNCSEVSLLVPNSILTDNGVLVCPFPDCKEVLAGQMYELQTSPPMPVVTCSGCNRISVDMEESA